MCRCPQRPEEGVRSPEAGVTGGCGLPKVDAGNRTLDLGKSSECFNHWTISLAKHPHIYITTVNKRSVFMEGFLFLVRSWNPRFSSLTVRAWQILEASHPQFCSMWNAVLHLMKAFKGGEPPSSQSSGSAFPSLPGVWPSTAHPRHLLGSLCSCPATQSPKTGSPAAFQVTARCLQAEIRWRILACHSSSLFMLCPLRL